jgi:hypothetical protein
MFSFKDPQNKVHQLSEEDLANGGLALLPSGSVRVEDEEAERLRLAGLPQVDSQSAINAEALAYLVSTDWYVIRLQETSQAIPADVVALRQRARERVK